MLENEDKASQIKVNAPATCRCRLPGIISRDIPDFNDPLERQLVEVGLDGKIIVRGLDIRRESVFIRVRHRRMEEYEMYYVCKAESAR